MTPEGWLRESQAALETFRSSGPDTEQRPAMLTVSVTMARNQDCRRPLAHVGRFEARHSLGARGETRRRSWLCVFGSSDVAAETLLRVRLRDPDRGGRALWRNGERRFATNQAAMHEAVGADGREIYACVEAAPGSPPCRTEEEVRSVRPCPHGDRVTSRVDSDRRRESVAEHLARFESAARRAHVRVQHIAVG